VSGAHRWDRTLRRRKRDSNLQSPHDELVPLAKGDAPER
jgi:hypothetical protein